MGKYRDQIKVICAYPWGLRLAEIADEIDARVDVVSKTVADLGGKTEALEARISQLEAKVAACCGGAPLTAEVQTLRDDIATLRTQLDALSHRP